MPARLALRWLAAAGIVLLAGCSQPAPQVSHSDAVQLGTATSDISTACGYAQEVTAFGDARSDRTGLASVRPMAVQGAQQLVRIYRRDSSDFYQGETISGILSDAISDLTSCDLSSAARPLQHALGSSG